MKLLLTLLFLISSILLFLVQVNNAQTTSQTSAKPLIEIIEGLVYQTSERKYFRAYIINNTQYLEFHNVTIGCQECFSDPSLAAQLNVSPPLIKNSDNTYTLPVLNEMSYQAFSYDAPKSAAWYVISSQ